MSLNRHMKKEYLFSIPLPVLRVAKKQGGHPATVRAGLPATGGKPPQTRRIPVVNGAAPSPLCLCGFEQGRVRSSQSRHGYARR